jgi:flagellar basal-body rod protein FlgG
MIKGIYKTAASMVPRERLQEIIANNLANAETSGFKKDSLFLRIVKDQQNVTNKLNPAWEVRMIDKIYTDYSEGALENTGRNLDLAVQGNGFFVVQTPNGEAYTRNGALTMSPAGILVNSDNMPILTDGGPLTIPSGAELVVGSSGQVSVNGQMVGTMRVVNFAEPYQLDKASGSLFTAPTGVAPTAATSVVIRQGYLEKSNVDVLREMVSMIESYRSFETGQKMIQMQDESLGKAVNELGKV